jgi:tetratricopeptide (TPR) repeat protein
LFWRPLRFPDLGAHAAAREFTEGDPDRHVKALEAAWRELSAGPPEPMTERPDRETAAPSATQPPDARLADFEQAVSGLNELQSEIQGQIKGLSQHKLDSEQDFARVAGDRNLLVEVVDGLEKLRVAWLTDLQQFKEIKPDGVVLAFADFQRRLEDCESAFQESFRSLLNPLKKRVDRPLDKARSTYATVEPLPSRQAEDLAERFAALQEERQPTSDAQETPSGPAPQDRAVHVRTPPPPPAQATARERVAHARAAAEQALDAIFAEAWQTLEIYPSELRHRDALVLLRGYLGGRQAEAELRLGRPTAARRRWTALLADDPVRPAVLHNLAVAHTSAGDPAPAAEAWSRYIEAIYLRDLLNGDVCRGAAARADLHGLLAASFGTAALCPAPMPDDERDQTERQIPPLLASRAKVALVAAHLRLEELNRTYSHRSPTVLLGIERNEAAPAEAHEHRATVLGAAVLDLPPRIRGPFEKECLRVLDEARDEAGPAKGRIRRPGEEAEETAHAAWVQGRVRWKYGILGAIVGEDADWQLTEYSGAVIANLRLIDELTLDSTDPMLTACLQQLRPNDDPAKVIELLDHLSPYAARFALGEILTAAEKAAESDADARSFAERFRRIGRSWGRDAVPERMLEMLDDPLDLYADTVEQALEIVGTSGSLDEGEREIVTAALPVLERWVEGLPGATGPARALARLLGALDRHSEALRVLARADAEAFSSLGRRKVLRARALLDIVRGEFAAAVAFLRRELEETPDDEQLRGLLTHAFDRWIESKVAVPSAATITEAFARWTDEDTVGNRRVLVLNAAMAESETPAGKADAGVFVRSLRGIVAADPDHLEAHFHLSGALIGQAQAFRDQMVRTAGAVRADLRARMAAALTECEKRTVELLPRLEGEKYAKHREQLTQLLQSVRDALK